MRFPILLTATALLFLSAGALAETPANRQFDLVCKDIAKGDLEMNRVHRSTSDGGKLATLVRSAAAFRRARSAAGGDSLESVRIEAERGLLAALGAQIEIYVKAGAVSEARARVLEARLVDPKNDHIQDLAKIVSEAEAAQVAKAAELRIRQESSLALQQACNWSWRPGAGRVSWVRVGRPAFAFSGWTFRTTGFRLAARGGIFDASFTCR